MWRVILLLLALTALHGARAADRFFVSSDGVRLHYIESGPAGAPTIVFVPGWTMPAWIFQRQIDFFSSAYHVVAFDPRGQGDSEVPAGGYEPGRRGADIADLIAALGNRPVLLVGWSLGVLDSLAYAHQYGDARLTGMVLIDNSVGEEPAPTAPPRAPRVHRAPVQHDAFMRSFVRSMFRRPQDPNYLELLTEAALRTPQYAARALLSYPEPRSYWREGIYMVHRPILYIVRPGLSGQAENLAARHPDVQSDIYTDAGHALFIDDGNRFDAEMLDFIRTRVHP
jgi:non-heme chloroperoxidase